MESDTGGAPVTEGIETGKDMLYRNPSHKIHVKQETMSQWSLRVRDEQRQAGSTRLVDITKHNPSVFACDFILLGKALGPPFNDHWSTIEPSKSGSFVWENGSCILQF